ncbi:MAG: hypothetical protein ACOYL6_03945 [Bacteriovoracaceae bacterium]
MQALHRLKILKNSGHQLNTSIFVLLSMVFLHMIGAKHLEISGFSPRSLEFSLKNFIFYPPLALICIYSIRKFRAYSSNFLLFYMGLIWAGAFWILYLSHLDKVLLGLIFFEVLISFYFYLLWNEELNLACHNPDFTLYDLDPESFHQIQASLIVKDSRCEAILSNWDDQSCFVKLVNPISLTGEVKLEIVYDGQNFEESGKIVSEYGDFKGVGIKWNLKQQTDKFNWKNFYEVIYERGILPLWVK